MRSLSISISSIFGESRLCRCEVVFRFHAPREWGMLLPVLLHVSGASCQHRIGSLPREWMIGNPHRPREWMTVGRATSRTPLCRHNHNPVSHCESGARVVDRSLLSILAVRVNVIAGVGHTSVIRSAILHSTLCRIFVVLCLVSSPFPRKSVSFCACRCM